MFVVLRLAGLRWRWCQSERTRRGWHMVIRLVGDLEPAELVALQALLGSDRKREALNIMRVIAIRRWPRKDGRNTRWNLLFERKLKI